VLLRQPKQFVLNVPQGESSAVHEQTMLLQRNTLGSLGHSFFAVRCWFGGRGAAVLPARRKML
jgi:hypothetical protein